MDYRDLVRTHRESRADVTIAAIPVREDQTPGFGLMKMDDHGRVSGFVEKPKTADARAPYYTPAEWIEARSIPANGRHYLANMGVYLFNTDVLFELLNTKTPDGLLPTDFGKEVFPLNYQRKHVQAHLFDGFWEDLGTIKSYHECSLALAEPDPPFDFFTQEGLIYTRMRNLPASRIDGATLDQCTVADGCVVGRGTTIEHSLIGVRSRIGKNCRLKDVVMIGSDRFEAAADLRENRELGRPDFNVGDGSTIERAILDKDCRIGRNVRLTNGSRSEEYDDPQERFYIRDGIICVPRAGVIPDGTEV
jgi:glucose-1-phosphate adenylyltransferase